METRDRVILEFHKYMVRNILKKTAKVEDKMDRMLEVTGDPEQNIRTQKFWQSEAQYDQLLKEHNRYIEYLKELNMIRNFTDPAPIHANDYHFVFDYPEILDKIKYQ